MITELGLDPYLEKVVEKLYNPIEWKTVRFWENIKRASVTVSRDIIRHYYIRFRGFTNQLIDNGEVNFNDDLEKIKVVVKRDVKYQME